jgi:hypothetical protein
MVSVEFRRVQEGGSMQIKINMKDLVSGLFLILLAVIGWYLNQDHNLGTARRMGPGYMPLMVFWIQMGLGILVTLAALFSGPDPLEKWTGIDIGAFAAAIAVGWITWRIAPMLGTFFAQTYNAVGLGLITGFLVLAISRGWRVVGVICAAVALFGILLEKGGFFLALTATIVISAFADRDHRPLGVVLMTVFLLALCWWVFINQLDIRVNMWPTS